MKKGSLIILVVIVIAMIWLATLTWLDFTHYESGINENHPSLDWLPKSAQDVTYYNSWISQNAEFSVDKEISIQWCEGIGRPLKRITEKSGRQRYTVSRPRGLLEGRGELKAIPESDYKNFEEYYTQYRKDFDVGDYYYSLVFKNNGGYSIGYDVDEGKAYYQYEHH